MGEMMTSSMANPMGSTMTGMPIATSSATEPLGRISASHFMSMERMAMVFFSAADTPLFSWTWIPQTIGQYAGTCIFLVAFAAVFRALLAMRIHAHEILAVLNHRSRPKACTGTTIRPWRANEAFIIAGLDVVIAGVGYLL